MKKPARIKTNWGPKKYLTAWALWNAREKKRLIDEPPRIPVDMLALWNAKDGVVFEKGGTWSYGYAGPMYDDDGVSVGAVPAIHHDADGNLRGVWGGPAYANLLPAQASWTTTGLSITTDVNDPGLWTAAKTDTTSWRRVDMPFTPSAGALTCTISLRAGDGTKGTDTTLGVHDGTAFLVPTVIVLSGPGGVNVEAINTVTVTGLTDTPTIIRVGWTAAAVAVIFRLYPCNSSTTIGDSVKFSKPILVQSPYAFPYVPPATSVVSAAGTSSNNGLYLPLSDALTEAFAGDGTNPATCTVAALVSMGVGTADLVGGTTARNTFTVKDSPSTPMYIRGTTGAESTCSVPRVNDGSGVQSLFTTFPNNSLLLLILQTKADGSQYRPGLRRYNADMTPIDTNIVWTSWVNFDGSFDPTGVLRMFYDNAIPTWARHLQIWNRGEVSDADILKWAERS